MKQNFYNNNYNDPYGGYQNNDYSQYSRNTYDGYSYDGSSAITLAEFSKSVYLWMFAGLAITFAVGFILLSNPAILISLLSQNSGLFTIVALVEVALVFVLGFFVYKLPSAACLVIFFIYSILNGLVIAPTLLMCSVSFGSEGELLFNPMPVFGAFAATACVFGAMSLYGMITKRNLSGLGTILFFGLLGLIGYSAVSFLFQVPMSDLIISLITIALFIGFTAYDTQKIKRVYSQRCGDQELLKRSSVVVALELYLDFINLFLAILNLFFKNRN